MATAEGTWAYRDRHGGNFGLTYFRRHGEGVVSSVGLGTYLGDPTDAVDDAYREAIVAAPELRFQVSGCPKTTESRARYDL